VRTKIAVICILAFSLFFGFVLRGNTHAASPIFLNQDLEDPTQDIIATLDDCIQKRFLDVDQGFGIRRIIPKGETAHRFKPENAKELSIVGSLRKVGLDMVLYLAGRQILKPEWNRNGADARKLVKGPVLMTETDQLDSPTTFELFEHTRKAMQMFQTSNKYDFAIRNWRIAARPVRASDASCLKCHFDDQIVVLPTGAYKGESRKLEIGDPLGVVLYAYKTEK